MDKTISFLKKIDGLTYLAMLIYIGSIFDAKPLEYFYDHIFINSALALVFLYKFLKYVYLRIYKKEEFDYFKLINGVLPILLFIIYFVVGKLR